MKKKSKLYKRQISKKFTRKIRSKYKLYQHQCAKTDSPIRKTFKKRNHKLLNKKSITRAKHKETKTEYYIIEAPTRLDLYDNKQYLKTVNFVDRLREHLTDPSQKIAIDFKHTNYASAAATLLTYATIEQAMQLRNKIAPPKIILPLNNQVRQILAHVGILTAVGSTAVVKINAPTVKFWKHQNAYIFDGELLYEFLESVISSISQEEYSTDYYEGLKEAIGNVVDHAYDSTVFRERQNARNLNKWWIYGGVRDEKKSLIFVVCDLGIGIPRSLDRKHVTYVKSYFDQLREGLKSDGEMIKAATKLKRSRTGQSGRGHGLNELREMITLAPESVLQIYSAKGRYRYHSEKIEQVTNYSKPVNGTIVELSIPVSALNASNS